MFSEDRPTSPVSYNLPLEADTDFYKSSSSASRNGQTSLETYKLVRKKII